jgi:hypothetical protein
MLVFRILIYALTLAAALFFAFWEMKIRRTSTDEILDRQERVSDYADYSYDIRREIRRERVFRHLPREVIFKLRIVAGLKIVFAVLFVLEVLILQRL